MRLVRVVIAMVRLAIALALAGIASGTVLAGATSAAVESFPDVTPLDVVEPLLARFSDAPELPADAPPPDERSIMRAANGRLLGYLVGDENRVLLSRDEIPDTVVDALLAAEDNRFYEHRGIDLVGIGRAFVRNVEAGRITQGGSTITQQLVENVYMADPETVREKIDSAYFAVQLERRLSKDEILTRYLNRVYFGQQAYGISTAAERYFSASVDELRVDQVALLIGLVRAPSALNPIDNPDAATNVRNIVLNRMVATGRLDAARAARARERGLGLKPSTPPPPRFPFFTEFVRRELLTSPVFDEVLGTDREERERLVYGGGLTIRTTLRPRLQRLAKKKIERVVNGKRPPQATLVTLNPGNGNVQAIAVGPREFGRCRKSNKRRCKRTMVNPAVAGLGGSGRQPGSAFKPFVAATALREGVPRGWEMQTRGGQRIEGCRDGDKPYKPQNYSPDPGVKNMRQAVRVSSNVYFAKLAGLVSPVKIIDTARRVGLTDAHLPEGCSIALGSGSVTALEMAAGYATFAADGRRCDPRVVTHLEVDGTVHRIRPRCERVLDRRIARQVTGLLQHPVRAGTATAAQIGRPVAGKTGTTQDYRDAWFVGYVPQRVTATWIGFEQPRPLVNVLGEARVTGGSVPARLWAAFMKPALRGVPVKSLPSPALPRIDMPRLRGERLADVRDDLGYDLQLKVVRVDHHRRRGVIVGQRPAPGTSVIMGSKVLVRVSNGRGARPSKDEDASQQQDAAATDEPSPEPQEPASTGADGSDDGGDTPTPEPTLTDPTEPAATEEPTDAEPTDEPTELEPTDEPSEAEPTDEPTDVEATDDSTEAETAESTDGDTETSSETAESSDA